MESKLQMENDNLEVLSQAEVNIFFNLNWCWPFFVDFNKTLSTILHDPSKPFSQFWSHSFFMAGAKKEKIRKQKFKAAKKEAAVIKLDDWNRNIAYIGKG